MERNYANIDSSTTPISYKPTCKGVRLRLRHQMTCLLLPRPGLRSRSRSRSRPESVVLTGVGVGVGVGKFSSTPTPARSRSRLHHFFIISFLVKLETNMEAEHYVLPAECRQPRWFAVYGALIAGGCVCFRVN